MHAMLCAANASFSSTSARSETPMPARANAIRVAARMVREDLTRKITEDLANVSAQNAQLAAAK